MRERFDRFVRVRIHDEKEEEGFTLIELLIVIVVLGILAAVTVFGLSGTASQSAVSACKSDARTVEVAVDAFHANDSSGLWPASLEDLTAPGVVTATNPTPVAGQPAGVAPYLRSAPSNLPHYSIVLASPATGQVNVEVPAATPPGTNFDITPNPCEAVK
jgi:general secretion pathway protein G